MIVTVTLNPSIDRTLTVERVVWNEMNRAVSARLDWSGKGINVSRALLALGEESLVVGMVGGYAGQQLRVGLAGLGITTRFTEIAGETRTNVTIAASDTGDYVKVNEPGPLVSAKELREFLMDIRRAAQAGDIWVLSGSLPPGAPSDLYAQIIRLLREAGAQALLDTEGDALRWGCQAGPRLIKPNALEAGSFLGFPIQGLEEARQAIGLLLAQGPASVALSLGEQGLILATAEELVWSRPPAIVLRSPVGAGDSLLAGIAWAIARGLPLVEQARWGVAAGAAAASCEGTGVGSHALVQSLYAQVSIQVLS